jgi:hypothetical protein
MIQARNFIGELRESARPFYAATTRDEVSDANAHSYLLAVMRIEEIYHQIDEHIAALLSQGIPPWHAFSWFRYPLAFIRAARTYQVFVRELLAADAAAHPQMVGYLPRVTYDQANALCHQILPNLQRAVLALNDANYVADVALPLTLGPRIESEGEPCPIPHLQGMIATAREIREWATGLLAQYDTAISTATKQQPTTIVSHRSAVQGLLAQADSQLRFGVDLVGRIPQGNVNPELHEEAETSLWNALQSFFLLNQAIASPEVLHAAHKARQTKPLQAVKPKTYQDRRILPEDFWVVAAPSARSELYGSKFGTEEMDKLCRKMDYTLSARAQCYLDEVSRAEARGNAVMIAAIAKSPFEPLYKARHSLTIGGTQVPANHEFHWNFLSDDIEVASRFGRVSDWQKHEE